MREMSTFDFFGDAFFRYVRNHRNGVKLKKWVIHPEVCDALCNCAEARYYFGRKNPTSEITLFEIPVEISLLAKEPMMVTADDEIIYL